MNLKYLIMWLFPSLAFIITPQCRAGDSVPRDEFYKDCTSLSQPGHYPDYEPAFGYSVEFRDRGSSEPGALFLQISTVPEGLLGASPIRLGCKIGADFPKEAVLHVLIFDEKKSAQKLRLGYSDQPRYGLFLWHLRARYELDRRAGTEFVEIAEPDVRDGLLSLRRVRYWLQGYKPTD